MPTCYSGEPFSSGPAVGGTRVRHESVVPTGGAHRQAQRPARLCLSRPREDSAAPRATDDDTPPASGRVHSDAQTQRRPDTAARAACDELLCRTEKYIAHLMHMFHPTWLMSSEKTLPLRRHVRIFQEACRCGTLISGHCGGSGRSECGARELRSFIARYQG